MTLVNMQLDTKAHDGEREAVEAASSWMAIPAEVGSPMTARISRADPKTAEIPAPVVRLLRRCLAALSQSEVGMDSIGSELSTQQAPDLVGVSHPFHGEKAHEGRIPARRAGAIRRIAAEELVAYRAPAAQPFQAALDDLSDLYEWLGLVSTPDGDGDTISIRKDRKSRDA